MSDTYSFKDVNASLTGPGGFVNLGAGSGSAKEGITTEPVNPSNVMTIGADGEGMHSPGCRPVGNGQVRLLKTSPVNAQLQHMHNLQKTSSRLHGRNTIVIRDVARGDFTTLTGVAFREDPSNAYASEGGMIEWTFDAIKMSRILGTGTPAIV